nr:hypothetical protein GCM10020093_050800 [Planobispora longispora]
MSEGAPIAPAVPAAPRTGTVRRLLRHPLGLASAAVLAAIVLAVLFAPALSPADPGVSSLRDAFGGPSAGHPLGFDSAGRDILTRLLYGGRNTLGGAVIALSVALALGVPGGLLAGYYGGWFDSAASWIVNLVMALPAMVVLLASRAILGPTVWVLMVVLGFLVTPAFFRLVRGIVASVRNELYVDAAKVSGLRDPGSWSGTCSSWSARPSSSRWRSSPGSPSASRRAWSSSASAAATRRRGARCSTRRSRTSSALRR